jgi:nicotinate phosphoribosyltransferase
LYELTMAAAYFESEFRQTATFELFVRTLPDGRGYLLAAGLEQALDYLESLRFTPDEIEFIRRHPAFKHISSGFFDYLGTLRFTGEVWAAPEGTPVFGNEPLLRVTAPIIEAQIVETFLLNVTSFQTMIATKAARVVDAAGGRDVIEFGSRRAHGPAAGVLGPRAAFIGGCVGTSNVEAGYRFGIPTYGTMAHSFILAYASEEEAFSEYQRLFPHNAVLLIDTYDTLAAVDKIIRLSLRPQGVRIDSGDLAELSREVRTRLDRAGLSETKIFASGDLDERRILELLARGAPIDAFGVGTALATSKDAPALGGVYKLVEVMGERKHYVAKFSEDKATYPGSKQVFRFSDVNGMFEHDVVGCADEQHAGAEPILTCVMRAGGRLSGPPPLTDVRAHARRCMQKLPQRYRRLPEADKYPVHISEGLQHLFEEVRNSVLRVAQPPSAVH